MGGWDQPTRIYSNELYGNFMICVWEIKHRIILRHVVCACVCLCARALCIVCTIPVTTVCMYELMNMCIKYTILLAAVGGTCCVCVCCSTHTLTQTAFTITIHSAIVIVVGNKHSYVITPRQRRHLNRCTRAESTWFMTNGTIIIHTKRSPRVCLCACLFASKKASCVVVCCGVV